MTHHTPLLAALGLAGCAQAPSPTGAPGDSPALHRLTQDQLNLALRDLFNDEALLAVNVPQEIAVHGFDNNALTRDATPYLVESLQRDLTRLVADEVADGGVWMACAAGGGDDSVACGHATLVQTQQRAWRRPTTADERAWITDRFDQYNAEVGFEHSLQLSLLLLLQSPEFLYLVEVGDPAGAIGGVRPLTDWEMASRLSFLLWDTMPDEALFAAASAGELSTADGVRVHARRMLQDERSREASLRFYKQWLGYRYIQDIEPDPDIYFPDSGDDDDFGSMVADLKAAYMAEFELFVRHAAWERGTLDALLTSRQGFVTPETARLYGVAFDERSGPSYTLVFPTSHVGESNEATVMATTLPAEQRAGIFTQGAFLAGHSHAQQPSPVLRGVFLRERLLCMDATLPPDDIPALDETEAADWTTNRERFAAHTDNPQCAACHVGIDGVGFPFENYDAIGGWRDTDNGAPVDSSGELAGTDVDGTVTDAVDLIETLAASRQVYDCAVTNLYRYGMHRSETDVDEQALAALQQGFWDSGGTLPDLLVEFAASEAFRTIRPSSPGASQ